MLALLAMKPLLLFLLLLYLPACQVIQGATGKTDDSPITITNGNSLSFEVTQSISLVNEGQTKPEKHHVWVALISDHSPYQKIQSREIQPANHVIVTDEYGNHYAEFDFKDLEPNQRADINISYELVPCKNVTPPMSTRVIN